MKTGVWSKQENKYLREHAESCTAAQIAAALGRTRTNVVDKAYRAGINILPEKLYMLVTPDAYELPIDFADTPTELGEKWDIPPSTICRATRYGCKLEGKNLKVVKVQC